MHEPTPEQAAILAAAARTTDNLLIVALAGAAKTTTLEMIAHRLSGIPILSLAFNKRIADELTKRLPSHCECRTLNALGHRVWSQVIGRQPSVAPKKMTDLLRAEVRELPRDKRTEANDSYPILRAWLAAAKRQGYVPRAASHLGNGLCAGVELDEDAMPAYLHTLCERVLTQSIKDAYDGLIDYDDQLYMPTLFGGSFPKYPLVLVDEAQDLTPLNHEMLAKLYHKRLIAVGDPNQSIYGFRGALTEGMSVLAERYSMREMPLSVTFRVPRSGVLRARRHVPTMQWAPDAPDGAVHELEEWNAASIPEGAAIICRNNAPLFRAALRLLRSNRRIQLVGMDIGANLLRIMRKLGEPTQSVEATASTVRSWAEHEIERGKSEDGIYDKMECLMVFLEGRKSLGDAIAWAETLFKQKGTISLLSGHKAKGLEWETVFHLDPWRIPSRYAKTSEALAQEQNIAYVIETRFKRELFLVNTADWRAA